jgi:4,5-DOPA dioxygenase extradiol
MTVLFLSHGPPTYALAENPTVRHWRGISELLLEPPKAVLCVSAHWDTPEPRLAGGVERPAIQHDFSGFPAELYRIGWDVQGSPEWAARIMRLFPDAADPMFALTAEPERPLDHGVWVPLRCAWPKGEVPVLQLSISTRRDGTWHLDLGRRLAALRREGVLIVASGGITHNLERLNWSAPDGDAAPWAATFITAFEEALANHDLERLANPWSFPNGQECHPTLEHYLPLLVALGAAEGPLAPIHRGWTMNTLALHTYAAGTLDQVLARAA